MRTEIEVKFLNIDVDGLRRRLQASGGKLVMAERILHRRNFDFPDLRLSRDHHAWVRVRDEGDKVTITYKQTDDHSLHGTKEVDLAVADFDTACQLLSALGLKEKSYQETKRESWSLGNVHVEIDTWPWIPTFIELEAPSEQELREATTNLGFDWSIHIAGDVTHVYKLHYVFDTHDLYHEPIVFGPIPAWLIPASTPHSGTPA